MRFFLLTILFYGLWSCGSAAEQETTTATDTSSEVSELPEMSDSAAMLIDPLDLFAGSQDTTPHDKMTMAEVNLLQEGDIILRKGYGTVSDFIATFLDEDYPVTHCDFIVKEGDSIQGVKVLHSASNDEVDGMYMQSLVSFILESKQGTMAAVRLKGSQEKKDKVMSEAFRLLEKQVPFDMGFDDYDTTEMYCAEMMRYIFMNVYEEDLLDSREQKYGLDVIHMDNFFDPDHFEVIFNHFPPAETEVLDSITVDSVQ